MTWWVERCASSVLRPTSLCRTVTMALLDRFERFLDQVMPASDEAVTIVQRGETFLGAGDACGALRAADEALAMAPGFLRALMLRVDALAALGHPADALAALETARRERTLPAVVLAKMIELQARLGDEAAAVALEPVVRARLRGRDPEVARCFLRAARDLLSRGRESAGLRFARTAMAVDSSLGEPWLLLGRDAVARGDRALARRSLERGVGAIEVTDATANRLAGELAWSLGERAIAVRCLRRAWIAGDEGAIAPLMAALTAGDDVATLERILADVHGELGDVTRGLLELARGRAAPASLLAVHGERIPEVLWHYALDVTLRAAPELAERWCTDAPERPSAAAVRALRSVAERPLGAASLDTLDLALADPTTRPFARATLREGFRRAWCGRLAAMLEDLVAILSTGHRVSAALVDALSARRRELDGPLRVVVLGEFSSGKSTFLNVLAGAEVSPMGVLPTTAHVHVLRHGAPGARIIDRHGNVVESAIEACAQAVARRREAGIEVDHVEVTLPLPTLARLELVDTPGFNSGDRAHDDAALRAVTLADVALWLFDARQAGKHSEAEAIETVIASGVPVIGVLNKIDQVPEGAHRTVVRALAEGLGARVPCVAAVSARAALVAMRSGGGVREVPGWTSFLAWLDVGLLAARDAWKSARVAGRAKTLLTEARAVREARAERWRGRVDAARRLGEQLVLFREALARAGATLRREVDGALRDQLRTLAKGRGEDREALAADAVAEACWRARERAVAGLRPHLSEVERLGVLAGLAHEEAPELLTAPVVQWLDQAAALGARDAMSRTSDDGGGIAGDPLAWLDAAADRVARAVATPDDALDVALDVALEALDGYVVPEVQPDGALLDGGEASTGF